MTYFILGAFFGALVMFCARLVDKDITKIVERYNGLHRIVRKKPVVIPAPIDNEDEEDVA